MNEAGAIRDVVAQLRAAADELPAVAVRAPRPLDRELDVVAHELERRVRIGPVEGGEVELDAGTTALAIPR